MDLALTADLMKSSDYKERFKAEYFQLKIRSEKLHAMLLKYEAGTLDFTPSCSFELLKKQYDAMKDYLFCLEARVLVEKVDLQSE